MQLALSRDQMLQAFLASDEAYDGRFWTCVRTTGIFCRPSCRARKPLPRNVEFVGTAAEALRAGFRPCKRCHPLTEPGTVPAWAQELMDAVASKPDTRITDADLRTLGVEPAKARRWFQAHYGVTFHGWQRAWRLSGAVRALRAGEILDDLPAAAGYGSASGFRDAFAKLFGAPPGRTRQAFEAAEPLLAAWLTSPLGPLLAVASDSELVLLEFVDRRGLEAQLRVLARRFQRPVAPGTNGILQRTETELAEYFAGKRQAFDVPVTAPGSDFESAVWKALAEVPYGATTTYAKLAAAAGRPGSARAAGRANGANRLAIVLPCHRVIGSDGALTGYAGGLERKRWLLDHESHWSAGSSRGSGGNAL